VPIPVGVPELLPPELLGRPVPLELPPAAVPELLPPELVVPVPVLVSVPAPELVVPEPDPAAEEPLPAVTPELLELPLPLAPLELPPEGSTPDDVPPPPGVLDELPDEQAATTATSGITKHANGTLADVVNRIATFPRSLMDKPSGTHRFPTELAWQY